MRKQSIDGEWSDNIPDTGVLCWVWGQDESKRFVRLIKEKNDRYDFPFFDDTRNNWYGAEPISVETAIKMIYRECK